MVGTHAPVGLYLMGLTSFHRNNHFAAIASDQPALETFPPEKGQHFLHEVSKRDETKSIR